MDIVWGAGRLLAAGSVEIDDIAALGPKADPGIHFPPNPLVGIAAIDVGAGVGLDWKSWDWILSEGRLVYLLLIDRNQWSAITALRSKVDLGPSPCMHWTRTQQYT